MDYYKTKIVELNRLLMSLSSGTKKLETVKSRLVKYENKMTAELRDMEKEIEDIRTKSQDDISKELKKFDGYKRGKIKELENEGKKSQDNINKELEKSARFSKNKAKELDKMREDILQLAKQKQKGFPLLAEVYSDYLKISDKHDQNYLIKKKNPALKASQLIKKHSELKRKAIREKKIYEYLNKYYESICPFLIDIREDETDDEEYINENNLRDYTEKELEDKTTNYLTKDEYRKLPTVEKNQMALDRYWKRPKSKKHIGKIYERYIGYIYEEKGYDVEYVGIFKGLEDLGRDVIAVKGNKINVIQCKYWSKYRTIYEKHIFQFFGTVFKYKDDSESNDVTGTFYTTTNLSDLAKRFSKELGIELKENFKMNKEYPCIKCNISRRNGEKIYHMPFDQQYDKVKVEKDKGEFYCSSVKEAEEKGFRRAFRYKRYKNNK